MNKKEIKELRKKLDYVKEFIEKKCVYDEHLQGYCFDLSKGDVRTLMYNLKEEKRSDV